jgi:hypothetical protein
MATKLFSRDGKFRVIVHHNPNDESHKDYQDRVKLARAQRDAHDAKTKAGRKK